MRCQIKKIVSLMLVLFICITSGYAFEGTPTTQFEYVLQQIEKNSLYTQDEQMSKEQIAQANAAIEQDPNQLSEILNEYLKTLDSHSMFLSEQEYSQAFYNLTEEQSGGIGVTLQLVDNVPQVIDVEQDSPAQRAGIQIGDILFSIDGVSVDGMTMEQIGEKLRGSIGSQVKVEILRGQEHFSFSIQREYLAQSWVSSTTVQPGIEYIRVLSLGTQQEIDQVKQVWNSLEQKGTKAVILDLRSNGGGLVDGTLEIADLILEDAGIEMASLKWREDQGGTETYFSNGGGYPLEQICVLVDENTASAAELLTGILMQSDNVEVVGTQTYGKGQAQYHMQTLGGKYYLIVTCMEMQIPGIGCWEGEGLTPTVIASENSVIQTALSQMPDLPQDAWITYGEQSESVHALSGRLYLLGYMDTVQTVFDTTMLQAVRTFQQDQGLTPGIAVGAQTIQKINAQLTVLQSMDGTEDRAYDTALSICQKAISQTSGQLTQEAQLPVAA